MCVHFSQIERQKQQSADGAIAVSNMNKSGSKISKRKKGWMASATPDLDASQVLSSIRGSSVVSGREASSVPSESVRASSVMVDVEEEEEAEEEEEREARPARPKPRPRMALPAEDEEEEVAEGGGSEDDDEVVGRPSQPAGKKKRLVVDSDEEDE